MREIFITVLVFGLIIFLTSPRSKKTLPASATDLSDLTDDSSPKSQPTVEHPTEPQSVAENAAQPATENTTESAEGSSPAIPTATLAPLLDLEPDVTLPLATSLPLQDAIQPAAITADTVSDIVPNAATIVEATNESDTRKAQERDYQNVLEEIAQLDEGGHETTIASLSRQVNHSDPLVRATAAMTLGDLATKNQGRPQEEMIALLNELLQDSNSEVRLQAAAALGKM
jgi:hypothetical protein